MEKALYPMVHLNLTTDGDETNMMGIWNLPINEGRQETHRLTDMEIDMGNRDSSDADAYSEPRNSAPE